MASKHYTAKWLNKLPIFLYVLGVYVPRSPWLYYLMCLGVNVPRSPSLIVHHNLVDSILVTGNRKYDMVLLIHILSYSVCRMFKDHELFVNIKIVCILKMLSITVIMTKRDLTVYLL